MFEYREVQLNFTSQIEVLCTLVDRSLTIFVWHLSNSIWILQFPVLNPVGAPCTVLGDNRIQYCDSFNMQSFIQKYCKMFGYCDKSLIVTQISNNHSIQKPLWRYRVPSTREHLEVRNKFVALHVERSINPGREKDMCAKIIYCVCSIAYMIIL